MSDVPVCPECTVPNQFIDSHLWLGGGTIVQSADREHRMVLLECANLDPLFKGIEEIIGVPIERIVIETKRRATRDYLNRLIPDEIKDQVRSHQMSVEPLVEAVNITGHILGYGDSKLVEVVYEDRGNDFVLEHIRDPYSVLLWCGDLAGSSEAVTGKDHEVTYKELADGTGDFKAWPSPRPEELQDRLQTKEYKYVEGDIELERCPNCGGPSALSAFKWDTEIGTIEILETGRRVALLGSAYLEAIFDELERELGEEIPGVVVEAQRRFTTKGIYSAGEIGAEDEFRKLLALRGLGNLREMKMDKDGLRLRLQNATLHLMMAGLIQGYFETAAGTRSNISWELKKDGTLELEITPKT
jgi:hypothetical protein